MTRRSPIVNPDPDEPSRLTFRADSITTHSITAESITVGTLDPSKIIPGPGFKIRVSEDGHLEIQKEDDQ